MEDCIFCKIAAGEIPSKKVYDDGTTFAFLDINPLARGHTLVVPKRHAARLGELGADEAARYFASVPRLVAAVERGVGAQGATVAWNDGRAAGQEVQHVHLHIVPRFTGDGAGPIHALFRDRPGAGDLEKVHGAIRAAMGRA